MIDSVSRVRLGEHGRPIIDHGCTNETGLMSEQFFLPRLPTIHVVAYFRSNGNVLYSSATR